MILRQIKLWFFILVITILSITFVFAKPLKIKTCSPNVLSQGTQKINLTLVTESPMPQKTLNEFLYSSIQFSNPGIHIEKVAFQNAYVISCTVSLDKYIDVSKPIDIVIESYDETGAPMQFVGKKILRIKRQPFIDKIIVHNKEGKVRRGEDVYITLRGYNFVKGKLGVLLMWSGLPIIYTDCKNEKQVRFLLKGEESKKISQPGEFGIYLYNKDGSACEAGERIFIE